MSDLKSNLVVKNATDNLVKFTEKTHDMRIDLVYAKDDNIGGRRIYKNHDVTYLHQDALNSLEKAMKILDFLGYKIKIYDAFRPIETQQILWDKHPDETFVSNPKTGIVSHCRGIAVDIALLDKNTMQEIDMGVPVDTLSELSYHDSLDISVDAKRNRAMLLGVMIESGFVHFPNEWWHYNLPNPRSYPVCGDIDMML